MKRCFLLSSFALLATIPALAGPVTVYTDRPTWQTAAGTTGNIDFEGLAAPDPDFFTFYPHPAGLALPGATFTAPGVDVESEAGWLFVIDPAFAPEYDWGSGAILDAQEGPGKILVTLDNPVFAFGVDLMSAFDPGGDYLITLSTGETFTVTTGAQPNRTFFGVTADDVLISWALFTPQTLGADGALDNVGFSSADAVPEPATGVVLLTGLALLGAMKFRGRK